MQNDEESEEPKIKSAMDQLQSALLQLEKTCSGITVTMLTSLVDTLQKQRCDIMKVYLLCSASALADQAPTTTGPASTVNFLLQRWEQHQFPKEEYLKYLVYLRQQQDERTTSEKKTLRKGTVRL
jgi:hypothetical protein